MNFTNTLRAMAEWNQPAQKKVNETLALDYLDFLGGDADAICTASAERYNRERQLNLNPRQLRELDNLAAMLITMP